MDRRMWQSSRGRVLPAIALALLALSVRAGAVDPCDPATNAAAVAEARQAIGQINDFMGAIRSLGLPVPPQLVAATQRLTSAIETGIDIGEAAGQVDYQVQQIVARKEKLCEAAGEDEEWPCKARIARQWQARNVDAVLNWNNTGSVVRRLAATWTGSRCRQPNGVRVDVRPTGHDSDLSRLGRDVLRASRAR